MENQGQSSQYANTLCYTGQCLFADKAIDLLTMNNLSSETRLGYFLKAFVANFDNRRCPIIQRRFGYFETISF